MIDFKPADFPNTCNVHDGCGAPAYTGGGHTSKCTNPECGYYDEETLGPRLGCDRRIEEGVPEVHIDPNVKSSPSREVQGGKRTGWDSKNWGAPPTINIPRDDDNNPIAKTEDVLTLVDYDVRVPKFSIHASAPKEPKRGQTYRNTDDGELYAYDDFFGWSRAITVSGKEESLRIEIDCDTKGLQQALEETERKCHALFKKVDAPIQLGSEDERFIKESNLDSVLHPVDLRLPSDYAAIRAAGAPLDIEQTKKIVGTPAVPTLSAEDICSVQPMTAPTGLHFYFDTLYSRGEKPNKNGDVFPKVDYAKHEERVLAHYHEVHGEVQSQLSDIVWDANPPKGIGYTEHKLAFVDKLSAASGKLFQLIRLGSTEKIFASSNVMDIIRALPGFRKSEDGGGTLCGRWKVLPEARKDPNSFEIHSMPRGAKVRFITKGTVIPYRCCEVKKGWVTSKLRHDGKMIADTPFTGKATNKLYLAGPDFNTGGRIYDEQHPKWKSGGEPDSIGYVTPLPERSDSRWQML